MKATVHITLKNGVLDPQGKTIHNTLSALGFSDVEDVRQGKYLELTLKGKPSQAEAQKQVEAMCNKLLANTVVENYRIELIDS